MQYLVPCSLSVHLFELSPLLALLSSRFVPREVLRCVWICVLSSSTVTPLCELSAKKGPDCQFLTQAQRCAQSFVAYDERCFGRDYSPENNRYSSTFLKSGSFICVLLLSSQQDMASQVLS